MIGTWLTMQRAACAQLPRETILYLAVYLSKNAWPASVFCSTVTVRTIH